MSYPQNLEQWWRARGDRRRPIEGTGLFCECSSTNCFRRLSISYELYRQVRRQGSVILKEHLRKGQTVLLERDEWVLVEIKSKLL